MADALSPELGSYVTLLPSSGDSASASLTAQTAGTIKFGALAPALKNQCQKLN